MLRMIFVVLIICAGVFASAFGPFYALLFYLWNAYFRPEMWTYGPFILSLHLSLIIGAYLVVRTVFSLPQPNVNIRTLLLLAFLAQSIIGTMTSEHPLWSASFLSDYWKVLLISYLIVVLVDDRDKLRITVLVIALSLGFECAKQGWANLFRAPGAKNDNPIPFLGDNNGVALGTMMLVPLFGALGYSAKTHWERFAHRFLAVGVFMRGLTTYSRGGFLAAAVLGGFMLVRSTHKFRTLLGIAVVAGIVYSVMPGSYWDRIGTIQTSTEGMDESAAGRLHFWSVAVDMARAKPLTGVGLNGFELSYQRYNTSTQFTGVRATHSSWFGVLADLGVPGLVLFLGNWFLAVLGCWTVARHTRTDPDRRDLNLIANALMTSLIAYAVAGSFLSFQYNEMIWHFFALATATVLIEQQSRPKAASRPQRVELTARVAS